MGTLSVIIPARNEQFLQPTIEDLLAKAHGGVEVIPVLDGYWPDPPLKDNKRLVTIHRSVSMGMRPAINAGVSIAKGKYIMKCDAHCMFDDGYDVKLIQAHKPNWVQVPTRKRLDAENWRIQEVGKPDIESMYLSYPNDDQDRGGPGLHGRVWTKRMVERKDVRIDDDMSAQGSCWFMTKDYFNSLELMDTANYGQFGSEFQEIGLKCWLSGGEVKRNKTTWYAHLHKGKKYGRGYFLDKKEFNKANEYTNKWITNEAWHKQTRPFSWIIEHFWPIPEWDDKRLGEMKQYDSCGIFAKDS